MESFSIEQAPAAATTDRAAARSNRLKKWIIGGGFAALCLLAVVWYVVSGATTRSPHSSNNFQFNVTQMEVGKLAPQFKPGDLSVKYDALLRVLWESNARLQNIKAVLLIGDAEWEMQTHDITLPPISLLHGSSSEEGEWDIHFKGIIYSGAEPTKVFHLSEMITQKQQIPMKLLVSGEDYLNRPLKFACPLKASADNSVPPVFYPCNVD